MVTATGYWSTDNSNYFFEWPGLYTMYIAFPARYILDSGSEGPYQVNLALLDGNWGYLIGMDYQTQFYAQSQFEWPASLIPPAVDHGLDMDGDGLFEYLSLEVTVEVTRSDWYVVQAYLYPEEYGMWMDGAYDWRYLEAGTHTIELLFPGQSIIAAMIEGPIWYAINLYWELPDGSTRFLEWFPGTCSNLYSWTTFEPGTTLAPPHSDHLEDRDNDGLVDWLAVDVMINVEEEGKYTLGASSTPTCSATSSPRTGSAKNLKPGLQTITLYFSGVEIWAKGLEGPYQVELRLFDRWGNQIEEGDHYVASEFGPSDCERLAFDVGQEGRASTCAPSTWRWSSSAARWRTRTAIDPRSVRLGDGEEWARPCKWEFKDVNHDGRDDLVLKFKSKDLKEILRPGEDMVVLQVRIPGSMVQLEKQVQVKFGRCDR